MAGRLVPLLLFADDIVLLAGDKAEMRAMLRVTEQYAKRWRFMVNTTKTKLVPVGSRAFVETTSAEEWSFAGKAMEVVSYYKYLGMEMSAATRGKWNRLVDRLMAKAKDAMNLLFWQGGGGKGVWPKVLVQQWGSLCRSILEYGAELWEGELSDTKVIEVERVQSKFLRLIGRRTDKPAAVALRAEYGVGQLKCRRKAIKLLYYEKLCNATPNRLLAHIFAKRRKQVMAGGAQHSALQALKKQLVEWGFSDRWTQGDVPDDWRAKVIKARAENMRLTEQGEMATHSTCRVLGEVGKSCVTPPE